VGADATAEPTQRPAAPPPLMSCRRFQAGALPAVLPAIGSRSVSCGARLDRQPGGPPFGIAILKPADLEAARPQLRDRFVGQHAVGAAAVGDDLICGIEISQAPFGLAKRDVDGPRQLATGGLILGPDAEHP